MSSIFRKIINNEVEFYKIYETDKAIAFLDIFPVKPGHTIIIPKTDADIENWVDIDSDHYNAVHDLARIIAPAIQKATGCLKVGQKVDGRDIKHFHLHLIPLFENHGFSHQSGYTPNNSDFLEMQAKIKSFLD